MEEKKINYECYVIVRGDRSGVFFGQLASRNGQEVELRNVRKLWYWSGAAAVEQIAVEGVKNPDECKFTVTVDSIVITDAIQIIPCTEEAVRCIQGVAVWKM